jgi:site-specific recombinase XerD
MLQKGGAMTHNWKKFQEAWIRKGEKPRTIETQNYRRWVIQNFIRFSRKPWREITHEDIVRYRAWMEAEEYARSTTWISLYILHAFFKQALLKGLVNVNPVKVETIPHYNPYDRCRFLPAEEENKN